MTDEELKSRVHKLLLGWPGTGHDLYEVQELLIEQGNRIIELEKENAKLRTHLNNAMTKIHNQAVIIGTKHD